MIAAVVNVPPFVYSQPDVGCALGVDVAELHPVRTDHRNRVRIVLVLWLGHQLDRCARQRHHRLGPPVATVSVREVDADDSQGQLLHSVDLDGRTLNAKPVRRSTSCAGPQVRAFLARPC